MVGGKNKVEIIIAARDRTRAAFTKVNAQMRTLGGSTTRLNSGMGSLKSSFGNLRGAAGKLGAALGPLGLAAVAAAAAVAVVSIGVAAVKSFAEFEDAMASVRKTTGFTKSEIKVLGDAINTLALRIPVAQTELAGIAAVAGQLGIQGKGDILSFTETVAMMITAFDMSAESVAIAMAKLGTIYDIPIEQTSNLGSAINVLGNTTAASESQIMAFSMALGPTAQQLGFAATEAISLGASMISIGMDASAAGTRLNRAFSMIGQNLDELAKFMGITTEEFTRSFEDMPMETFMAVLEKLSQVEGKLKANTVASELFNEIGAKAIKGLTGNLDGLRENLANSKKGFDDNTSLAEEFAAKTDTLNAKFKIFGNTVESFKIQIGEALAPLAGVLVEGARKAITELGLAFNALQRVIGIVIKTIKPFFDAIQTALASALTPLVVKLKELRDKFKESAGKLTLFSDIITIATAGAKWLGEKIGVLVKVALTPLIQKLKEGIDMLITFYNKLGPIKDLIEGAKGWIGGALDSIHDLATNIKEAEENTADLTIEVEKVEEALSDLGDEGVEAPAKIEEAIEDTTQKMKEFIVTIGDTTIEFKGAAAEVVKNADAYAKLQDSAQTLIDLDWSVFREFEASLPNIEAGLGDLESSFVGFKDVLEENIDKLEAVEQSVMDLSEIAAPFLEAGFLNGIKAIGDFAGALKNAGSAISDFTSLQDVSIDGAINFSLHVRDMVSALEILESQMEDLVPAFGNMDSLIDSVADAFLYGGDKAAGFFDSFDSAISSSKGILDSGAENFNEFKEIVDKALDVGELTYLADTYITESDSFQKKWKTITVENAEDVRRAMHGWLGGFTSEFETTVGTITSGTEEISDTYRNATMHLHNWVLETYGVKVSQEKLYEVMQSPPEEQKKWLDEIMHSEKALTFQMDKQTNALKAQTDQLAKITDALQPYLNFMRTLNELAALSTLSTEELNAGLNSIKDTLVNLGTALSDFDLRSAMEGLFAPAGTAGSARGFMDTMEAYQTEFNEVIKYTIRLTTSITDLVVAFDLLADIGDSVLADQTKLKEVFEGITTVMTNFSVEMGGTEGFAKKFAAGMDAMLKSADPLILYFRVNNAAVTEFNAALLSFKTTITNVIDVFEALASVVKRSSELVVISAKEIEAALALVDDQLIEIGKYLQSDAWSKIDTQLSAVSEEWKKWAVNVDTSMPAFNSAVDTFSTLISKILGLSSALKDMRDMSVLSVRDIDEALKNIPVFLDRFVDALALNMGAIKESLKELHVEWGKHAEEMKVVMPSYEDSTASIGKLVGSLLSLHSAMESLSEMGTISEREFGRGFKSLMESITNFATSFSKNAPALIESLWSLERVWLANQSVIAPLMENFLKISANFIMVANNANAMTDAFRDIQKNSGSLEKGFKSLIDFINQVIKATKEFYTREAADELAGFITDVGKVIDAFYDLEKKLKDAMGTIKNAIGSAVNDMETKILSISSINESMYIKGGNTLQSYINGLKDKESALETEMWRITDIVQGYLATYSNAKLGPLSHLDEWAPNLMQSYSSGIEAEMHTLNSSFAGLAPGVGVGSAGGNKNVNFYVTQHISDRATADYANRDLERLMHKHAVM